MVYSSQVQMFSGVQDKLITREIGKVGVVVSLKLNFSPLKIKKGRERACYWHLVMETRDAGIRRQSSITKNYPKCQ